MNNTVTQTVKGGRTVEKEIPSAIPFWTASAVWILCAFALPMYKLSMIVLTALISAAAAIVTKKILPKETKLVELPFESGDEKLDSSVRQLDEAQQKLVSIASEIGNRCPETGKTLNETAATLAFIRSELIKDNGSVKKLRRFFDYYLPTELKLAEKYREMVFAKKSGEYSMNTFLSSEKALQQLNSAFKKQYDALFEDDSLDVETDIAVLDTMLKQDKLE